MAYKYPDKILIIEDELAMLKVLVDRFESEGFPVFQAIDGVEGLSLALQEKPDLILLDIVMPKMDGMTMMAKLREDEWGKNVPVIILTNLNIDDRLLKGVVAHEPSYYLVKSDWSIDGVVQKVKDRLGIKAE